LRSGISDDVVDVHVSGNSEMALRHLTGSKTVAFVGNNGSPPENFPLQQCQGDWYVRFFSISNLNYTDLHLQLPFLPILSTLFLVTLTMTVQTPWFASNAPMKWSPGVTVLLVSTPISASILRMLFRPCQHHQCQDQLSHQSPALRFHLRQRDIQVHAFA
jgi:hypothetical protein